MVDTTFFPRINTSGVMGSVLKPSIPVRSRVSRSATEKDEFITKTRQPRIAKVRCRTPLRQAVLRTVVFKCPDIRRVTTGRSEHGLQDPFFHTTPACFAHPFFARYCDRTAETNRKLFVHRVYLSEI